MRSTVAELFDPGWKHGRIEKELSRERVLSDKRRGAAEEMHARRAAKSSAAADDASAAVDAKDKQNQCMSSASAEQMQVQMHTQSRGHFTK